MSLWIKVTAKCPNCNCWPQQQEAPQYRVTGYLYRGTEEEEGQVEDGEAGQHVLLLRHGSSVFPMLTVHHHHVDHQAHHRHAEQQAQQEGALPPGHQGFIKSSRNTHFLYSSTLFQVLHEIYFMITILR